MQQVQQARAESMSALQNLGVPLSKASMYTQPMPAFNPVPGRLDFSLATWSSRTKRCCAEFPLVDRMASELYPLPAAVVKDARTIVDTLGQPSRLDGRDPVTYRR